MINTIVKILDVSKNSYFNYKKQKRPIIQLLEKYFSENELEEFLEFKKIEKFELIKNISSEEIKNLLKAKNNDFNQNIFYTKLFFLESVHKEFLSTYLFFCHKNDFDFSYKIFQENPPSNLKQIFQSIKNVFKLKAGGGYIINSIDIQKFDIFLSEILTTEELNYINMNKLKIAKKLYSQLTTSK